ncbi:MAG: hypothetical protein ACO3PB_06565 [Miltoncostaeaceae bacterium]
MTNYLVSLNEWVMVPLIIVLTLGASAVMMWTFSRYIRGEHREKSGATAAAYMTALGSLFAILTGFLINSEYSTLRDTQRIVGQEVAAASRLAYASASLPAADAELLQDALAAYLDDVQVGEWQALGRGTAGKSPAIDSLRELERRVSRLSDRPYVRSAEQAAIGAALDGVTSARRQRVVIATQSLPIALFALSVIAGIALVANSLLVSLRAGPRYGWVALGIVLVVALDLAAILAISAPFRGPFQVDIAPVTELAAEVRAGQYLDWVTIR